MNLNKLKKSKLNEAREYKDNMNLYFAGNLQEGERVFLLVNIDEMTTLYEQAVSDIKKSIKQKKRKKESLQDFYKNLKITEYKVYNKDLEDIIWLKNILLDIKGEYDNDDKRRAESLLKTLGIKINE